MRAGRFCSSCCSCRNCVVRHCVRGDLKVSLAVLHEDVGDSRNGRIRYVLTFFFLVFSHLHMFCVVRPVSVVSSAVGRSAISALDIELGYSHSQHSGRHRFSSTPIQVDSSSGRHQPNKSPVTLVIQLDCSTFSAR